MARRIIKTPLVPGWSDKQAHTSSTNFVPVTGPINTAHIKSVRISQYAEAFSGDNTYIRHGYNMSDNGIDWSATVTALGQFLTQTGWYYSSSQQTISSNQKLFVRFGLVVANKIGGGSDVEKAKSKLVIEVEETNGQTFAREGVPVWSDGSTTPGIFHAMTGAISADSFSEIRASIEMQSNSGDCQVQPAWQVSYDGQSWDGGENSPTEDSFTTFGTAQTADGTTYGSTFSSSDFNPTNQKPWVRFGVACTNGTSGVAEACLASLRIDTRL